MFGSSSTTTLNHELSQAGLDQNSKLSSLNIDANTLAKLKDLGVNSGTTIAQLLEKLGLSKEQTKQLFSTSFKTINQLLDAVKSINDLVGGNLSTNDINAIKSALLLIQIQIQAKI
ncbi:hypothetical protein [Lentilactobacillus laojiaonis]|uniref:hypothetical protein n=1 Tax=Lentilactobacillus laojiaonis TaxID=2883998 RepID=UPI001D0ACA63|nr:hypothetical protein [Lentilactobacillus laojiaonis]UDM31986.1 hypothetical protein LHL71_05525 [Lentilactobacillus laojiaonis]